MIPYFKSYFKITIVLMLFLFFSCKDNMNTSQKKETKIEEQKINKTLTEEQNNSVEKPNNETIEQNQRVKLTIDDIGTEIKGKITGYDFIDYLINLKKGQTLEVIMSSDNRSNYFNIMEPNEKFEAIYNASSNENYFKDIASKGGDYSIRVYMMRNAARRNEVSNYTLKINVD